MKPRFNIGDSVYFRGGRIGVRRAVVQSVILRENDVPLREPVYVVSLMPTLLATFYESQLFASPPEVGAKGRQS